MPTKDGDLDIEVADLCLSQRDVSHSRVRISGAQSIRLRVRDKVNNYEMFHYAKLTVEIKFDDVCLSIQVERGNHLIAYVEVLDRAGKALPAKYFKLMSLQPALDPASQQYVKITPIEEHADESVALYRIDGVELGMARLKFTARTPNKLVVMSNKQDIQVCLHQLHHSHRFISGSCYFTLEFSSCCTPPV